MKDCKMTPHEILNAIGADLDGAARDLWVGMCHQDRNEMVILIQRGQSTIGHAQSMIRSYVDALSLASCGDM